MKRIKLGYKLALINPWGERLYVCDLTNLTESELYDKDMQMEEMSNIIENLPLDAWSKNSERGFHKS